MKPSTLKTKGFKFKQFTIEEGQSGMPVSTDGVLLGAWAFDNAPATILDIGTGTGLLTLMCAQRFPDSRIEAIDIDNYAYDAAQVNIMASPWANRIALHQADVLEHNSEHSFDGIICNPPYFNSGEHSQHAQRATARHTHTLNHQHLAQAVFQLLSASGTASFILPVTEGEQFINIAGKNGLYLSRLCRVKPSTTKHANRLLFELRKDNGAYQQTELIVRNEIGYTEAFIALTRSFYLKM